MPIAEAVIASSSNPRVKQLRAALTGNPRLAGGLVAIEGHHLIQEALRSGIRLHTAFLAQDLPAPGYLPASVDLLRLSTTLFSSLSETRSPQGIAALIAPRIATLEDTLSGVPLLLIAAGLQDPGNLGTLVRSAEAFGASGLLLTPGTVSPWNGKALRASVGSIFRLPTAPVSIDELESLRAHGIRLLAAVGRSSKASDVLDISAVDLTCPAAILVGNEGAGLAPELLELADTRVTIPCSGPVESLNAGIAGSVILYEAHRQRSLAGARP